MNPAISSSVRPHDRRLSTSPTRLCLV